MKSFTYLSNKPIEECWDLSWNHWSSASGSKIINHQFFENDVRRTFTVSKSMGLTSWGETYIYTFDRYPTESTQTKIQLDVSLSFGFGAQWYTAFKQVERWCRVIGVKPIVFGKTDMIITYSCIACLFLPMILLPIILMFLK